MTMMIAAGGAFSDSRASRFTKEARRVAGRCLFVFCGSEKYFKNGTGNDIRGAEEELCHAEEPGTVPQVENIAVKEGIEAGVE
jgi:hypothetical protein